MQTYYLFQVKKNIYNVYLKREYSLYKVLYNLYKLNRIDLNYGVTLYNQLCEIFNVNRLKYYFELTENIRKGNNKYMIKEDKSLIILKPSRIIYKTNNNQNRIFYLLDNYSHYIFVCNFKTGEYFWLKNKINY
ncbi:MAG: sporulation inhibitor of replication protein SirA [Bacilli bacterium]|nr:sporulation inhibitor of replication protein SirA [Bacilli bacterium]